MLFGDINEIKNLNNDLLKGLKLIWTDGDNADIEVTKAYIEIVDEGWTDYTLDIVMAFNGTNADNYRKLTITVPETLINNRTALTWYVLGVAIEKFETEDGR